MSEKCDDQTRFVAGCRMAGYMPDSGPYLFDTSEEAMAYIRDLMRDAADTDDRWTDEDIAAALEQFKGLAERTTEAELPSAVDQLVTALEKEVSGVEHE